MTTEFISNMALRLLSQQVPPRLLQTVTEIQNADIDYILTSHVVVNGIMWFLMGNLAILAATLRHIPIMKYIHGAFLLGTIILAFVLSLPLLNRPCLEPQLQNHRQMGIIVLICSAVQMVLGIIMLVIRRSFSDNSIYLLYLRRTHMIIGYISFQLAKISALYIFCLQFFVIFLLLLCVQIMFLVCLLYIKFLRPSLTANTQLKQQLIRPIISLNQISVHYQDYGLIGNYIYDLKPLRRQHPGGYEIIKNLKEKELDRYLFGMYGNLPQISPVVHTADSMKMLGEPFARLDILSPHQDYCQQNAQFVLKFIRTLSEDIYELSFAPKHFDSFQFYGYSNINQLGRYRSMCIQGKMRLYSAVNFLNARNKRFMKRMLTNWEEVDQGKLFINKPTEQVIGEQGTDYESKIALDQKEQTIPIMIKKYTDGKVTPLLLDLKTHHSVQMSGYKGAGLRLGDIQKGKVILVGAGTGCFPFYDLIDLLFKMCLVQGQHPQSEELISANPILKNNPFKNLQFVFLGAYVNESDIHGMIYEQMCYLASKKQLKCTLKIKNGAKIQKSTIKYTNERFEDQIIKEMNTPFAKVIVCGNPQMNFIMQSLLKQTIDIKEKWMIL